MKNEAIQMLTPELMFKYQERLLAKMKENENANSRQAMAMRVEAIDAFIDNCFIATMQSAAPAMTIDKSMFDLPLLSQLIGSDMVKALPQQIPFDWSTKNDEVEEAQIVEEKTEVTVQTKKDEMTVMSMADRLMKMIGAAPYDQKEPETSMKRLHGIINAGISQARKHNLFAQEVDRFEVLQTLLTNTDTSKADAFWRFMESVQKMTEKHRHPIHACAMIKSNFPTWELEEIGKLIEYAIMLSDNKEADKILNPTEEIIKSLQVSKKNDYLHAMLRKAWPEVECHEKGKAVMVPSTEGRAIVRLLQMINDSCSPIRREEIKRRKYKEKGYPEA